MSVQEGHVIKNMLHRWACGENGEYLPVIADVIGTKTVSPLSSIGDLRLDYTILDEDIKSVLIENEPQWENPKGSSIAKHQLDEALNSLFLRNQKSLQIDHVDGIPTVPVADLNMLLIQAETESIDANDFWITFDRKYPNNGGYATSSRVGFSDDQSVAILYFTCLRGPLFGHGAFKILLKHEDYWDYVGGWPHYAWTS